MTQPKAIIFAAIVTTLWLRIQAAEILKDTSGDVHLKYVTSSNGMDVELIRNGKLQLSGRLGIGQNLEELSCLGQTLCSFGNNEQILIEPIANGFNITWFSDDPSQIYEDCYDMHSDNTNWFGGPEHWEQKWPLEKINIDGNEPYVVKYADNRGVAERYWLNSRGTYIFLSDTTPLWVDQKTKTDDQVCFRAEAKAPYINRWRVALVYVLVSLDDPKIAHLNAVNDFLGKAEAHPNVKMIEEPIWTTWSKYKRDINDGILIEYANEIRSHGYTGGQLEIDDAWETCYGSQEFDGTKFADINNTVAALHNDNWRVSLWIHPFVNDDCQNNSRDGQALDYFVKNTTGQTNAVWWNGDNGQQIDFTKPAAAEWWVARLKNLQQELGLDSYKFDAGEPDYANQPNVYEDVEHAPNILTQNYIETVVQFGDLIEVRSSFRAQRYGEFIRMMDRDSKWDIQNGLPTLVTTLLQFNMNGYVMVLPDIIGGDAYVANPTAELMVRWTQANTFMPAMQFSFLPWDFKDDVTYDVEGIIKKFVDLHVQYTPNIIRAMNVSITNGTPVNPPIWWVDPTDATALGLDDEYLLGEEILVAPVLVLDAVSRDVYLPQGEWIDGNNGTVYTGPITLKDYYAPIEILPYFFKQ